MTVYLIGKITIKDRDEYANYEAGFMDIFGQYEGKLLAVDESPEVIEGSWVTTRTVLTSFPSKDAAKAWYQSEAYQSLAKHRWAASNSDIAILTGMDEMFAET